MDRYEEYMQEKNDPVIFIDEKGLVTYINDAFTATFLWSHEELVGSPMVRIIPTALRDAHNMGFSRYKMSKVPTLLDSPLDLEIEKLDGEVVLAQHFIVSLDHAGKQLFAAKITLRD